MVEIVAKNLRKNLEGRSVHFVCFLYIKAITPFFWLFFFFCFSISRSGCIQGG